MAAPVPRRDQRSPLLDEGTLAKVQRFPSSYALDDPVLGPEKPRQRKSSTTSRAASSRAPRNHLQPLPENGPRSVRTRDRTQSHRSDFSATSTVRSGRASPRDALFLSQQGRSIDSILSGVPTKDAFAPSKTTTPAQQHDSLSKRWVRWMHKSNLAGIATPCAVAAAVLVRLAVGLGTYSGYRQAPLFGDFEAQRNWMSVTYHLPVDRWYSHNLAYWGLDYPPLTAYHSYIMGALAYNLGNPRWVAIKGGKAALASEDETKVFMRTTAIISELVVYVPAILLWIRATMAGKSIAAGRSRRSGRTQTMAVFAILFQPALILIDHGHFQYNSVMLGFTVFAIVALHKGSDLLAAVLFVASIGYKQMAIYYGPAMFAYLFGKCIFLGQRDGLNLFTNLAFVSICALAAVFAPFLAPPQLALQAIHRIFPFARGLFEDKVANVWCALNVVVKLRDLVPVDTLVRLSLVATVFAALPSMVGFTYLTARRGHATLPLISHALFSSAMAFFLFSFQVHEKSILLPLLPLTLLAADKSPGQSGQDFEWSALVNNVAMFSMWPLLKRDGLGVQYAIVTLLWNHLIGYDVFALSSSVVKALSLAVYAAIAILHLLEAVAAPPAHLPDLFVVLNITLSCGVFGLAFLWSLSRQLEEGWALVGSFSAPVSTPAPPTVLPPSSPSVPAPRSRRSKRSTAGSQAGELPPWSDVESRRRTAAPSGRLTAGSAYGGSVHGRSSFSDAGRR